jgi:hypothetical protein
MKSNKVIFCQRFNVSRQIDLFEKSDIRWFAIAFENMYSESRADMYQQLDKEQQLKLLPFSS